MLRSAPAAWRWQQCSKATADWAKQHNDDLEDRAIGAAGIHGFYTKRAYEGGGGRGVVFRESCIGTGFVLSSARLIGRRPSVGKVICFHQ